MAKSCDSSSMSRRMINTHQLLLHIQWSTVIFPSTVSVHQHVNTPASGWGVLQVCGTSSPESFNGNGTMPMVTTSRLMTWLLWDNLSLRLHLRSPQATTNNVFLPPPRLKISPLSFKRSLLFCYLAPYDKLGCAESSFAIFAPVKWNLAPSVTFLCQEMGRLR